jgi:hypothetical protein
MAGIIYSLCALTALVCACLLLQTYYKSRYRLLLWGALCFIGLTINNLILVIDKLVLPDCCDLSTWRQTAGLISVLILLYGLIWESE